MDKALAISRDRRAAIPRLRPPMQVMVVDDSTIARAVLSRIIQSDPDLALAGVAGTAEDAIEALDDIRVDVVLLDLEMPGDGGLKSIPRILAAARGAKVMIVSSHAEDGAKKTVAALALGAADTLPKPGAGRFFGTFAEILLGKLKALDYAPAPVLGHRLPPPLPGGRLLRTMPNDPVGAIAIGASTGGIHALGVLFKALPAKIGVPILVTQHLPPAFMAVFARQLSAAAGREVLIGENGMRLMADRIIIAPGESHLAIEPAGRSVVVRLSSTLASSGCRPSVDPMMATLGGVFGRAALGVMLTGMGRDGVEGANLLVAAGGSMIAQDESSSAVWGMPRAVYDAGLASALLPPDKIARRIVARTEDIKAWR